ncbi:MAG: hypothetical protein ACTSU5_01320 [Promethearchaeota archaeon]
MSKLFRKYRRSRGQRQSSINVPAAIADLLGWENGDTIQFEVVERGGEKSLLLTRVAPPPGSAPTGGGGRDLPPETPRRGGAG